jgi:hypothetical protein
VDLLSIQEFRLCSTQPDRKIVTRIQTIYLHETWILLYHIVCSEAYHFATVQVFDVLGYYSHVDDALTFSRWYILTILDLFLREGQLQVQYGYILFYALFAILKLSSEVAYVLVAQRFSACLLSRYQRSLATMWWLLGSMICLALAILALFFTGSFVANVVLFLQRSDIVINRNLKVREWKLEAAFYLLQCLSSFFTWAIANYYGFEGFRRGRFYSKVSMFQSRRLSHSLHVGHFLPDRPSGLSPIRPMLI